MTRHVPVLLGLSVLAVAGWAYNVNYETRAALDRLSDLRGEIAEERENLQVLRVEWAYLNAPDRLLRLVAQHQEELALAPLTPEALSQVAAVPYPPDAPHEPQAPGSDAEALIAAAPQAGEGADGETGAAEMLASLEPGAPIPRDAAAAGVASADIRPTDPLPRVAVAGRAGAPAETDAMRAAVAAALAEVGIVVRADLSGGAPAPQPAVVAMAGGVPMPQTRPAGWTPQ